MGGMLSKPLIQFSVDGWGCVLPAIYVGPNYGGGDEGNGDLIKHPIRVVLHSVPPALQQATTDPHLCWRLLDTHGKVWVSLLWGHCSFLLGPGAQGSVCALWEQQVVAVRHWSGEWPRGDTPCPRLGAAAVLCFTGCEKILHIQGQRRRPRKMVGGANSPLDSTPFLPEMLSRL